MTTASEASGKERLQQAKWTEKRASDGEPDWKEGITGYQAGMHVKKAEKYFIYKQDKSAYL